MNPRAYLLAALLVSPAWAQEPTSFDLKSDTIKKVVHDAASRQIADVQLAGTAPVESEPAEFQYIPPEKPALPAREPPRQLPAPTSPSNTFVAAVIDILADELLGTESDDVEASNAILRCRVQKDIKSSPPGPDNCPSVY